MVDAISVWASWTVDSTPEMKILIAYVHKNEILKSLKQNYFDMFSETTDPCSVKKNLNSRKNECSKIF